MIEVTIEFSSYPSTYRAMVETHASMFSVTAPSSVMSRGIDSDPLCFTRS